MIVEFPIQWACQRKIWRCEPPRIAELLSWPALRNRIVLLPRTIRTVRIVRRQIAPERARRPDARHPQSAGNAGVA